MGALFQASQLAEILDSLDQVLIVTDAEPVPPGPRILYVNAAFERMTGYSPAEALGNSPRMLQCPETSRLELARLRRMLETPELWRTTRYNLINATKSGERFQVELTIAPIWMRNDYGPTDRPDYWLAIQRLIGPGTDSAALAAAADSQRQNLVSVGNMTAGIAHEFNNILSSIANSASLGLSGEGAERTDALELVLQSVERGANLIRRLQVFAHGDRAAQGPPVSLQESLSGFLPLLRSLLPRTVALVVEPDSGAEHHRIPQAVFEQLAAILVTNGGEAILEAGRPSGVVTLRYGRRRFSEAELAGALGHALREGDYLHFSVEDTGAGVPDSLVPQLFSPFSSTRGRGRGLGLFTALGLVRSLKGAILLHSIPGQGSTFTVLLPVENVVDAVTAAPPRAVPVVAVSDDDEMIRNTTTRLVQRLGVSTRSYQRVAQVLADIERGIVPDAILADLNGSGSADHADMGRIVKSHPQIPLFIVSGVGHDEVERAAAECGATGTLHKPYSLAQLKALLRRVPVIEKRIQ